MTRSSSPVTDLEELDCVSEGANDSELEMQKVADQTIPDDISEGNGNTEIFRQLLGSNNSNSGSGSSGNPDSDMEEIVYSAEHKQHLQHCIEEVFAVFVMDHIEASAKIKKARTGTISWKDRHVLIYAKGHHNKGDVAQVYDVHICQKTKSRLQITVKSEVIGRQGQCQMYDYEDLIDEHWELPLHLVE
uniref:Uncharacterized protein n=1 Tax=Moniliophthora roreri TaxID=221103 RepID=A0A0W0G6U8_MONRR